ncbi:MAG: sigma-70 family RNA polymerase sigma factor [Gammaproteobacteria bacterium]|nr:sigma-70 family RNA polymerase sigma factor [Gammaproteobacteria bacterium]
MDSAERLLERIASGSSEAMADFYRQFESKVYAFALRKLNDPHGSADIVNEVMMAVWQGAGGFQANAKVSTWLLGITHNKVIDRIRKNVRNESEELSETMPDTDRTAAVDLVARAQDAERLSECMERLSQAHREVVHLAFFEDLTYGEIAEIVGCPEGTVKTRMLHAKQNLKRCLSRGL